MDHTKDLLENIPSLYVVPHSRIKREIKSYGKTVQDKEKEHHHEKIEREDKSENDR